MRHAGQWLAGLLAVAVLDPVKAAPPPPASVPEELKQPVGDYDLEAPFQLWRYWIEQNKGVAAEAVLARPDPVEGEQPVGPPLLRFRKHNDFGHFLTGEIQAFCRSKEPYGLVAGSCHYRLRRAYVESDSGSYEPNPVSRWMRGSFDAARLAAHFRASGYAPGMPGFEWWKLDRAKMFAVLPDPVPMLVDNATLVRLDSRDCPGLKAALEDLDRQRLSERFDFLAVGKDDAVEPLWPHSIIVEYRLTVTAAGGRMTVEGSGRGLHRLVSPVLDAADACERSRAESGGAALD